MTVTASDDTMVYGGSVPAITAIYAPAITPATPAVCSTLATNVSPVGSYASSCSGAVDSNYTFSYVNGSVSVTPAPVTVTASDDTMVYGGIVPTITAAYSPAIIPATPAVCSTLATNVSPVGSYASSCSGAVDSNYTFSYVNGSVSVTPAASTITWSNPADIVYGTILNGVQLDATASVPGTFVYSPASGTLLGAGAGQVLSVVFIPTDVLDYSGASATVLINVTKKPITVTADPKTKVYGNIDPALTYTNTPLVAGDSFTGALARVVGENVGTYAINQGTLSAGVNYTATYVADNLTITTRPITVTAVTDMKVYDGTTSSAGVPNITAGSLAGTDSVAWTQTFNTKDVGIGKVLNPAGIVNDGNGGNNYAVTFFCSGQYRKLLQLL